MDCYRQAFSTNVASFNIIVAGRVLYGIGSGTVVVVQEAILSQQFCGQKSGGRDRIADLKRKRSIVESLITTLHLFIFKEKGEQSFLLLYLVELAFLCFRIENVSK